MIGFIFVSVKSQFPIEINAMFDSAKALRRMVNPLAVISGFEFIEKSERQERKDRDYFIVEAITFICV